MGEVFKKRCKDDMLKGAASAQGAATGSGTATQGAAAGSATATQGAAAGSATATQGAAASTGTPAAASSQHSSSICVDSTAVQRCAQSGNARGSGRVKGRGMGGRRGNIGPSAEATAQRSQKRSRIATGFGLFTDEATGTQVLNPGTLAERLLFDGSQVRDASATNVDLGYKPRGLRWKRRGAITSSQLQNMSRQASNKHSNVGGSSTNN